MTPRAGILGVVAVLAAVMLASVSQARSAEPAGGKEARSDTTPYTTAECFAFWKLTDKLELAGVPALLAKGPPETGRELPRADMERITLYLKLEERLRFRCPDFVPPPVRRQP